MIVKKHLRKGRSVVKQHTRRGPLSRKKKTGPLVTMDGRKKRNTDLDDETMQEWDPLWMARMAPREPYRTPFNYG